MPMSRHTCIHAMPSQRETDERTQLTIRARLGRQAPPAPPPAGTTSPQQMPPR